MKPGLRYQQAAALMHAGGVVAYPTEGVWGLGCDPWQEAAVLRILALKQRPVSKGLILIASDVAQLADLLEGISPQQRQQLDDTWPGPNSWLVPHRGRIPAWIHGEHDTVAVRVSAHRGVRELCEAFGGAVVSTSANPGGSRPAMTRVQLRRYFGDALDAILPGDLGGATGPSTIRHLSSGAVIRA